METVVNLGPRSYPIVLQSDALDSFPSRIKEKFPGSKVALITNSTIAGLYGRAISSWQGELAFEMLAIPDGETYKTIETWNLVVDFLIRSGLDRKSVVCALGGGVVGDITGFAASAFLRGVAYVQIPTTLLAMVDSSVGGKTGVNHNLGKNLIGAFHQPSLVWMDASFLDTLPHREFVAGYAELFKYAFIGGQDMFEFVSEHGRQILSKEPSLLLEGIRRSIEIKAAVVASDERETSGKRALLNFGHTFAHAIERFYNFEGILHGEAVLFGIRCACDLARRTGAIPEKSLPRYDALLASAPNPALPSHPDPAILYKDMFTDKKIEAGKLTFVLPCEPGKSTLSREINQESVVETLVTVVENSA